MKKILLSAFIFVVASHSMFAMNQEQSIVSQCSNCCIDYTLYCCSRDMIETSRVVISVNWDEMKKCRTKETKLEAAQDCIITALCCPILFLGCHIGQSAHIIKEKKEAQKRACQLQHME